MNRSKCRLRETDSRGTMYKCIIDGDGAHCRHLSNPVVLFMRRRRCGLSLALLYQLIIAVDVYTDVASCTPLGCPPVSSPAITISCADLRSPSDHWTTAFLSTPHGGCPSVHHSVVYPSSSGRLLTQLDPLLRQLPAVQASLSRFSRDRVERHPSTRQSAFTVHHAPPSDLSAAGQFNTITNSHRPRLDYSVLIIFTHTHTRLTALFPGLPG